MELYFLKGYWTSLTRDKGIGTGDKMKIKGDGGGSNKKAQYSSSR
jgi:hypothetical protein